MQRKKAIPVKCQYCGHRLPPATRSASAPAAKHNWTLRLGQQSKSGGVRNVLESPPCPKCGKKTAVPAED
jgi:predicted RNA-binding Zn-ribbon protein involved in translation (DUF1610 family)